MSVITNTTFSAIKSEIEAQNQLLLDFVSKYGNEYQKMLSAVRAGVAPSMANYAIGNEIESTYTSGGVEYDFPWIIVDNNRTVVWNDGTEHPAIILMSKYATPEAVMFDAPEKEEATEATAQANVYYYGNTGTTYTLLDLSTGDTIPYGDYTKVYKNSLSDDSRKIISDGYNNYKYSGVRQWLNSSAGKNEWWESTHIGDKAPSQLSTVDGFMAGFESDFLEVITPVKTPIALNRKTDGGLVDYVYDKFWLPCNEEMAAHSWQGQEESRVFPYWNDVAEITSRTDDAAEGRIFHKVNDKNGNAISPRLRSNYRSGSNYAYNILPTGAITPNYAVNYGYSMVVCCAVS